MMPQSREKNGLFEAWLGRQDLGQRKDEVSLHHVAWRHQLARAVGVQVSLHAVYSNELTAVAFWARRSAHLHAIRLLHLLAEIVEGLRGDLCLSLSLSLKSLSLFLPLSLSLSISPSHTHTHALAVSFTPRLSFLSSRPGHPGGHFCPERTPSLSRLGLFLSLSLSLSRSLFLSLSRSLFLSLSRSLSLSLYLGHSLSLLVIMGGS